MSTDNSRNDQAQRLRQIVEESEGRNDSVPSLPPRKEIHQKRDQRKKVKLKLEYPLIRLLVLIFLLLIFLVPGYKIWKDRVQHVDFNSTNHSKEKTIEVIDISEQPKKELADTPLVTPKKVSEEKEVIDNMQEPNEKSPSILQKEKIKDPKYITHIVQPGETLYRISIKYFNSRAGERLILEANNLTKKDITSIPSGTELRIPIVQK